MVKGFLKIKEKIYESRVRSAMLYRSETWYLREKEIAILKRMERAMCGVKLMDRRNIEGLMAMLSLLDRMAKVSSMQSCFKKITFYLRLYNSNF